jgi:lysine/ornithine N-monooxygenase
MQVTPAIQCFQEHGVEFVDGSTEEFDVVILATGYKSNVPYWLKVCTYMRYIYSLHKFIDSLRKFIIVTHTYMVHVN